MKVYVEVPQGLSLAMSRVALALKATAPPNVKIVMTEDEADLILLHVIGPEALTYREDKRVAVVQYCTGGDYALWRPLWERAVMTWSYYDLSRAMPKNAVFYHAPLGIGEVFREPFKEKRRKWGVLTSGYVTGPGAEAIDEMTIACKRAGWPPVHLCSIRPDHSLPFVRYRLTGYVSDDQLTDLYRTSRYVSGLRFVEGFEMPAIEGLACGARPIMFSRPNDAHWFGPHARFVPECHGQELIEHLEAILRTDPVPVTEEEREVILAKFDWRTIARRFWYTLMEAA